MQVQNANNPCALFGGKQSLRHMKQLPMDAHMKGTGNCEGHLPLHSLTYDVSPASIGHYSCYQLS